MSETQNPAPVAGEVRRRARRRGLPLTFLTLYAIIALLFFSLTLFATYELVFRDRVILGVTVLGQPLQSLQRAEAKQYLQKQFGEPDAILARFGGEGIVLRAPAAAGSVGDRTWRAYPWELGLRTDFDPVAEVAIQMGHQGSILRMLADQARCLWFGCDLGTAAQFDEKTARAYLGWLAPQVDQPAHDASLRIDGLRVVSTPAQNGRTLDGAALIEFIQQRVLSGDRSDIAIPFQVTTAQLTDIDAAKAKVQTILAAPAMLTFNGRTWAIDQAALAGMLSIQRQQDADGKFHLSVSLRHDRLVAAVKSIAGDINQPARDARFHFDEKTGALSAIVPSQYGQTLDAEAAAKQIEQQLLTTASRVPGLASP
ncbi:MAG TPA: peptidoglycan binding domain-containing protein, partial [Anaerolineae bacterium]